MAIVRYREEDIPPLSKQRIAQLNALAQRISTTPRRRNRLFRYSTFNGKVLAKRRAWSILSSEKIASFGSH